MRKLCLLYTHDHRRHVVIRRQIQTFLEAGFAVSVIDQSDAVEQDRDPRYRYVHRVSWRWEPLVKSAWRALRRIPFPSAHEAFWRQVLWLRTVSNALRLAVAAWQENPDCYLAEDLASAWSALLAAKFRRRPVLYCAHELESEQGDPDEIRRGFLRALERKIVPRIDHLIVPNRSRATVYAERYQPRHRPTVVLNCPPTAPVLPSNRLRETLGLDDSVRVVLYHGGLIPFRSLDMLVRSAAHFDPGIVLVLMGDQRSYFRNVLAPLLATDGLRGRVFTVPPVPHAEVAPYVASADLGVVIYENVNLNNYLCAPLKLYEYIMLRVPIVACDFPEIKALFEDYPIGVTFDSPDPVVIARAVNAFFAKSEAERAEVRATLLKARPCFAWEREGQKWLDILQGDRPSTARISPGTPANR